MISRRGQRIALVTGGSGFLGGHLADRLVADGWAVRVLDVVEPAVDRLDDWIDADVRDAAAVLHAARHATVVFHLGAVVGVGPLLDDPVACIDVTVNGTRNALEAAGAAGSALVHLSTSEVLGRGADAPWDEGADRAVGSALVDRWSYGAAKAAAEHVVLAGAPSRGVPATVIRPFNVYGPRQAERFVVPLMVAAALAGRPIPVHGTGRQTRCFTYVDDVVDALVSCIDRPHPRRLLHIGSTEEVTIRALAELVCEAAGRPVDIELVDPAARWGDRFEDIDRRVPDPAAALDALGWAASTPLREGLRRTVAWWSAAGAGLDVVQERGQHG